MSALRPRVLEVLLARPQGATLSEVAAAVERASPPVLHHLQALVQEGSVLRDETQGRPRYRAVPFFSAILVAPETRQAVRWVLRDRVSWRYPLTSRIADARARTSALLFLREADRRGLFALPPPMEPRRARSPRGKVVPTEAELGLRIVVYGSVARGETSPASDLDLIALPGRALDARALEETLKDVAAEVNLVAPRRVDLKVLDASARIPLAFAEAVRREGFVLYSTYDDGVYEPLLQEDEP